MGKRIVPAALIALLRKQRDAVGLTVFADEVLITEEDRSNAVHLRHLMAELEELLSTSAPTKDKRTNAVEALHDIARHAQATQVKVVFAIQDKNLQLEVRDNGKGFDVNKNTSGHYGLVGMHERARLTGGMLSIKSNQSGTSVQFIVGRS